MDFNPCIFLRFFRIFYISNILYFAYTSCKKFLVSKLYIFSFHSPTLNTCSSWNPFSWMKSNEDAIEQIEQKMFKCVKTPLNRFYVNIRNNSLKIWTISCNTESANLPIVLVHGFCGAIGLWVYPILLFILLKNYIIL